MTSSNPDGASVRASSAISAKVGGTTTMRGRGMGGAVLVVPEYYIETGKPSSAPLGAMGDRLCKGLEAANNVGQRTQPIVAAQRYTACEPGPVGHDQLGRSSRVECAQ